MIVSNIDIHLKHKVGYFLLPFNEQPCQLLILLQWGRSGSARILKLIKKTKNRFRRDLNRLGLVDSLTSRRREIIKLTLPCAGRCSNAKFLCCRKSSAAALSLYQPEFTTGSAVHYHFQDVDAIEPPPSLNTFQ